MKVKSLGSVRLLATPKDSSLPGPSVHGIFQATVLEWVAIAFSDKIEGMASNYNKLYTLTKKGEIVEMLADPD